MRIFTQCWVLLASIFIVSCSDNDSAELADPSGNTGDTASYRLTFNASWSEASHALNFPGPSAHFSPLAGVVHNEQVRFWEPGQPATPGIQLVAETGSRSTFNDEVQAAIAAGTASTALSGPGISQSPGSTSVEFTVTRAYPEISIVSMLAPSPDWFVGLHNFSLLDNNQFIQDITIELPLYDSGTDDGTRYTSSNAPAATAAPVMLLTSNPTDTPFINGQPAVGTFAIQRLP